MNKIVLFFLFSVLTISIYAQNRTEAIIENNQKLLVLAKNYIDGNPNDEQAANLVLKCTQVEHAISDYMNKVSNGGYVNMGSKQKIEYNQTLSRSDEKLRKMNKVLKKSYLANHDYFSEIDANYESALVNFRAALMAGQYGEPQRRTKRTGRKN